LLWALALDFGFGLENRLKKQQQVPARLMQLMCTVLGDVRARPNLLF
jgi:hypothetical protein